MAITQILEQFVQGDDIAITINSDDNVTGYDCVSNIENDAGQHVAEFNTTINPPDEIVLTLAGEDSADLPAGRYRWDVKIITPSNKVVTVVIGFIEFLESAS